MPNPIWMESVVTTNANDLVILIHLNADEVLAWLRRDAQPGAAGDA
jgi:hypothetical protein